MTTWPPDPDFYEPGPYAPMALGYDDDPKVVALVQYGDDAGLLRDLHLAMIRYGNRARTDGRVPAIEVRRLAFPLSTDRCEHLARCLAEQRLIVALDSEGVAMAIADVMAGAMPHTWAVANYARWNRTRAWMDARHEQHVKAGHRGAEARWRGAHARMAPGSPRHHPAMAPASDADGAANGEPMATELELKQEHPSSSVRNAGAPARAAGAADDDDSPRPNNQAGYLLDTVIIDAFRNHPQRPRTITREQATAVRARLPGYTRAEHPDAYLVKVIMNDADPGRLLAGGPSGSTAMPPPSRALCRRCYRPGHPTEQCPTLAPGTSPAHDGDTAAHGAKAAREALATRERPARSTQPTGGPELHGEALARAQAAASRATRLPEPPPDEPPPDDDWPDANELEAADDEAADEADIPF
jgi:hypothetical protein